MLESLHEFYSDVNSISTFEKSLSCKQTPLLANERDLFLMRQHGFDIRSYLDNFAGADQADSSLNVYHANGSTIRWRIAANCSK